MPVEGLRYIDGFVTEVEEAELLAAIDGALWLADMRRRVQHYGYRYDYRTRSVDRAQRLGSLPEWARPAAGRLVAGGYMPTAPDQLIVNEYLPGQGIGPHVDAPPFGPAICSVSLGSACVMDFSEVGGEGRASLVLQRRGLLVLTGPARHAWKHGIRPVANDSIGGHDVPRGRRVSLTFRTVVVWWAARGRTPRRRRAGDSYSGLGRGV